METTKAIQEYLANRLPFYLEMLRQMVEINSFTANPQGVNALGTLTAQFFGELGFQAEYALSANQEYGRHLFLNCPAQEPGPGESSQSIAMISHLDTVFPPEEELENDFAWRPDGERIYGPGTVDIKGGTVMIHMVLDAIRAFAPQVYASTQWLVFIDATEEVLSSDFAAHCLERLPSDTLACLVFEGGTPYENGFSLVTSRKGRATYSVRVKGRSAHAGNGHPRGANAILQMSHTVQKIAAFTDYERQLTFNVGTIRGGSVVNRVPHLAEAQVEMRTFLPEVFQAGVENMLALNGTSDVSSADGYPCKVHVDLDESTAPWPSNPSTEGLYAVWEEAAASLGQSLTREARGGLSDGNFLWERFPTLDGLGPIGENAHCSERTPDGSKDQEYVLASSIVPKALLNTLAILKLAERLT